MAGIFLSYARVDSQFALRLAQDLRAAGAAVWIDQLDILPGQRWDTAVQTALEAAPTLLLLLSPASCASDNVMDEVSFAISKTKRVVPVLYQQCDIPFRLARLQWVNFKDNYNQGLIDLLKVLKSPDSTAQSTSSAASKDETAMHSRTSTPAVGESIPIGAPTASENFVHRARWPLAAAGATVILGGALWFFNDAGRRGSESNQPHSDSGTNRPASTPSLPVPKVADSPVPATKKQPELPKLRAEGDQVASAAKQYLYFDRSWRHDQTGDVYQFRATSAGYLDFRRITPPEEAGARPMRVKSIEHFDRGPSAWDQQIVISIDWDPFSGQDLRSFQLTPDRRLLSCMQTEYFSSRTETRKCQDSFQEKMP